MHLNLTEKMLKNILKLEHLNIEKMFEKQLNIILYQLDRKITESIATEYKENNKKNS
jgi:hypothetical protein